MKKSDLTLPIIIAIVGLSILLAIHSRAQLFEKNSLNKNVCPCLDSFYVDQFVKGLKEH